jgi:hypothetical protein
MFLKRGFLPSSFFYPPPQRLPRVAIRSFPRQVLRAPECPHHESGRDNHPADETVAPDGQTGLWYLIQESACRNNQECRQIQGRLGADRSHEAHVIWQSLSSAAPPVLLSPFMSPAGSPEPDKTDCSRSRHIVAGSGLLTVLSLLITHKKGGTFPRVMP